MVCLLVDAIFVMLLPIINNSRLLSSMGHLLIGPFSEVELEVGVIRVVVLGIVELESLGGEPV